MNNFQDIDIQGNLFEYFFLENPSKLDDLVTVTVLEVVAVLTDPETSQFVPFGNFFITFKENNSIPIITLNDGSTSRISLAPNQVLELQANSLGRVSFAIPISTDGQENDHTSHFTHNSMEGTSFDLNDFVHGRWGMGFLSLGYSHLVSRDPTFTREFMGT